MSRPPPSPPGGTRTPSRPTRESSRWRSASGPWPPRRRRSVPCSARAWASSSTTGGPGRRARARRPAQLAGAVDHPGKYADTAIPAMLEGLDAAPAASPPADWSPSWRRRRMFPIGAVESSPSSTIMNIGQMNQEAVEQHPGRPSDPRDRPRPRRRERSSRDPGHRYGHRPHPGPGSRGARALSRKGITRADEKMLHLR